MARRTVVRHFPPRTSTRLLPCWIDRWWVKLPRSGKVEKCDTNTNTQSGNKKRKPLLLLLLEKPSGVARMNGHNLNSLKCLRSKQAWKRRVGSLGPDATDCWLAGVAMPSDGDDDNETGATCDGGPSNHDKCHTWLALKWSHGTFGFRWKVMWWAFDFLSIFFTFFHVKFSQNIINVCNWYICLIYIKFHSYWNLIFHLKRDC